MDLKDKLWEKILIILFWEVGLPIKESMITTKMGSGVPMSSFLKVFHDLVTGGVIEVHLSHYYANLLIISV